MEDDSLQFMVFQHIGKKTTFHAEHLPNINFEIDKAVKRTKIKEIVGKIYLGDKRNII